MLIWVYAYGSTRFFNTNAYQAIQPVGRYSTEYTKYHGFGYNYSDYGYFVYGKRSEDGKAISWYNQSPTASHQFNENGIQYYYLAIG